MGMENRTGQQTIDTWGRQSTAGQCALVPACRLMGMVWLMRRRLSGCQRREGAPSLCIEGIRLPGSVAGAKKNGKRGGVEAQRAFGGSILVWCGRRLCRVDWCRRGAGGLGREQREGVNRPGGLRSPDLRGVRCRSRAPACPHAASPNAGRWTPKIKFGRANRGMVRPLPRRRSTSAVCASNEFCLAIDGFPPTR